jgi:hypothetical protein
VRRRNISFSFFSFFFCFLKKNFSLHNGQEKTPPRLTKKQKKTTTKKNKKKTKTKKNKKKNGAPSDGDGRQQEAGRAKAARTE